ncbi:hypothetical protein BJX76DRAFT_355860 [Aspergillus varians]
MKFTGIIASLAIASTAAAAAVPNLDIAQLQSTITHLDDVLTNIDGAIDSGSATRSDLADTQTDLSGIHDLLNGLVGGIVGAVDSSELLQGVLDLAGGLVTTVINTIGTNDQVPDFGILSRSLVGRIQNGEVDANGLQSILTVIGGNSGLANLNRVLSRGE